MFKYKLNKKIIISLITILVVGLSYAVYSVYAAGVIIFGNAPTPTVVSFTTVGTQNWTVPAGVTSVEVLVVGGGGAGSVSSNGGAGGGGGGLIYNSSYTVTPGQVISVTVGGGGTGSIGRGDGTSGANSVFGSLTAIGGGCAYRGATGCVGGSGGGGSYPSMGGAGTSGQGNSGGNGAYYLSLPLPADSGGGGGGAGTAGENGKGSSGGGGKGGDGLSYDISGTYVYYSGGGGGATNDMDVRALGGQGGGGTGGTPATKNGNAGLANTGGGGGGGNGGGGNSGNGGSGIVIVRYGKAKTQPSSIQKGLVGHWALDGDNYNATTGRVTDKTPYGNHGTNYGATLTTDRSGTSNGAMSFDGVNDYLSIADNNILDLGTRDFSASGWIYATTGTISGERGIINKNSTFQSTPGWGVETTGQATSFTIIAYNTNGIWSANTLSAPSLAYDSWHHFVLLRISSVFKLYVDGQEISNNSTAAMGLNVDNNQPIIIGDHSWGPNFMGKLSDIRIYNRVLSADEVNTLYNSNKPKIVSDSLQKGLVLDMPLNSTYTKTVTAGSQIMTDKTPYSNNGQNYGATVGADSTSFDGVNDYVDTGNSTNLRITGAITLVAWVKRSVVGVSHSIIRRGDWATYEMGISSGNKLYFMHYTPGQTITSIGNVLAGEWYQVAISRLSQAQGGNVAVYINGALDNTGVTVDDTNVHDESLMIGLGHHPPYQSPFNGLISNVKIYNRALSATEIKSLYDKGRQ